MKKVRGIWITNVDSDVLESKDNIENRIKLLAQAGFNVVFPVVWWGGYTLFRSKALKSHFPEWFQAERFGGKFNDKNYGIDPKYADLDPAKNRDPLQEMIAAAHKHYIKVIPWFEYGFGSSSEKSPEDGHDYILEKYDNFAAKDAIGQGVLYKPAKDKFRWMNAFNPDVQEFIKKLIAEVCEYDIDGVQGDERLPAFPVEGSAKQIGDAFLVDLRTQPGAILQDLDLSDRKQRLFGSMPKPESSRLIDTAKSVVREHMTMTVLQNTQNGPQRIPTPFEDENEKSLTYLWTSFRAEKLIIFLKEIHAMVKDIGARGSRTLLVSMAPECYPDGFTENLQDYEKWIDTVDMLHPQLYKFEYGDENSGYVKAFNDQMFNCYGEAKNKIFPGIALRQILGEKANGEKIYRIVTPDFLRNCIAFNRDHGINGEVFFFLGDFFGNALEDDLPKFFRTDAYQKNSLDDEGPDVAKIQKALKSRGHYQGEINGIFDRATEDAVIALQQAEALPVDGQVNLDNGTLQALGFNSLIAFGRSPF